MRSVESCVQLIRRHPEIFPVAHKDIRQAVVRRFPYSIFYLPTKQKIIVLSVFMLHANRKDGLVQLANIFQKYSDD